MRRVILAAALAATFCLSQTSLAQAVQNQPQGTPGGAAAGQTAMGTGEQAPGVAPGPDIATSSPRAGEQTAVGPSSEDAQVELARLRAEVDRLREELKDAKGARRSVKKEESGTGGSGTQRAQEAQPIASAIFEGRVKSVSRRSIEVIDRETGEPYILRVTKGTRARSGNQRIPVTGIREGSEVRASFDLISGDTYATQIDVLGQRRR
jgi:hypothetical protein